MYLENLVFDAAEPRRLGGFWEAVVDGERLTDEPEGFETRLSIEGGPLLDLCFQRVAEPSTDPPRLHLEVSGGTRPGKEADRLLGLGARQLDSAPGDASWIELVDPGANPFRVSQAAYAGTGPLATISLDSADPARDAAFWSWLTGWSTVDAAALRHPSLLGPVVEFRPEATPKGPAKNPLHLDVRLEVGEDPDDIEAHIVQRGGATFEPGWGELPWRSYTDPSGNEFCVLPAPA